MNGGGPERKMWRIGHVCAIAFAKSRRVPRCPLVELKRGPVERLVQNSRLVKQLQLCFP